MPPSVSDDSWGVADVELERGRPSSGFDARERDRAPPPEVERAPAAALALDYEDLGGTVPFERAHVRRVVRYDSPAGTPPVGIDPLSRRAAPRPPEAAPVAREPPAASAEARATLHGAMAADVARERPEEQSAEEQSAEEQGGEGSSGERRSEHSTLSPVVLATRQDASMLKGLVLGVVLSTVAWMALTTALHAC